MTVATLKDSSPTTTITFDTFKTINYTWSAKGFNVVPLPDNEGVIIIYEGQSTEFHKCKYQIKDDPNYPSSGDSCSTKWEVFRLLLKTGGDSQWLFTLTFDKEDSTPSSPNLWAILGKVRLMTKRFVAGDNVNHIEGEFEFWAGELT